MLSMLQVQAPRLPSPRQRCVRRLAPSRAHPMPPGRNAHLIRLGLQLRRVLGCANAVESLMASRVYRNVKRRCGVQMFVALDRHRHGEGQEGLPSPEGLQVGHRTPTGLSLALYHPTH
jgi:hypothetical protein